MKHFAGAFGWDDLPAMQAFARRVSFAHIFAATADGPMAAHAPVLVADDGGVLFHLAHNGRIVPHLAGTRILISISADDFYVSPDWYADANGVPTWDYIAVEIEGDARALTSDELIAQLDDLSAGHEARLAPKSPWTRAKMPAGRFEAMLPALRGFAVDAPTWRGTRKLSQNRTPADRIGVAAALEAAGRGDLARLVEQAA